MSGGGSSPRGPPTVPESALEGYLSSVLVDGPAVRRVDAVALPVDSLHQPVVPGPSDRVQPRRKATLRQKERTLKVILRSRGGNTRFASLLMTSEVKARAGSLNQTLSSQKRMVNGLKEKARLSPRGVPFLDRSQIAAPRQRAIIPTQQQGHFEGESQQRPTQRPAQQRSRWEHAEGCYS